MAQPVQILGIRFFNGNVNEVVDLACETRALVVAPAAPALVKLCHDEGYRRALTSADIAIADSGWMVLLWKLFRGERVERVSGLKYLKRLVQRLRANRDERVLWILPSGNARAKTLRWLDATGLHAGGENCYVAPRYEPIVHDDALLAKIEMTSPAHIVVGIGGGVQEKLGLFIKQNAKQPAAIHCIGAALGFLTGDQPPIPMWADRFYLGWLLRLLRQPHIYGPRYLSAFKLPWLILKYRENLPPVSKR